MLASAASGRRRAPRRRSSRSADPSIKLSYGNFKNVLDNLDCSLKQLARRKQAEEAKAHLDALNAGSVLVQILFACTRW